MRTLSALFVLLAISNWTTALAGEALVEPGATVTLEDVDDDGWPPQGTLVAEQTIPFEVDYRPTLEATLHGSLYDAVFRRDDGGLTFAYRFSGRDDFGTSIEHSSLNVRGFAGFRTDVVREDTDYHLSVHRSQDGGQLEFKTTTESNGVDPPIVWVKTDATLFDVNGSADWTSWEDYFVFSNGDALSTPGTANLNRLYQPIVPEPFTAPVAITVAALLVTRRTRRAST